MNVLCALDHAFLFASVSSLVIFISFMHVFIEYLQPNCVSVLWTECLHPTNSHVEALTPGVVVFAGGASREVVEVK